MSASVAVPFVQGLVKDMYGAADFKVCLTSFEFSLFFQNPAPKFCPSCGHFLDASVCSEG